MAPRVMRDSVQYAAGPPGRALSPRALAGLYAVAVVARVRRIPNWLPILVLFGEFVGRAAFFTLMLTSGSNIGNPF